MIPVQPTNYTVTFDSNGGSAVTAQTVPSGSTATKPADPTKDGYTFKGWYNDDTAYDFTAPVTANLTLVAQWEEIPVIIKQDDLLTSPIFALVARFAQKFEVQLFGEHYTISGDTAIKYRRGGTVEIVVEEGYEIVDVVANGQSLGAVNEVTFKKVTKAPELLVITKAIG